MASGRFVGNKLKMEAKVISLTEASLYKKELELTIENIKNFQETLYNHTIQLAVLGKWKEWSDAQPIGTYFEFDEEMLRDTGDSKIDEIWRIIIMLVENLKK